MALIEHNTLWREEENHAKFAPIWRSIRCVLHWFKTRKHPHVKGLNDHHMRDIGLSSHDVAVHRHRLPSQHTHHPRG